LITALPSDHQLLFKASYENNIVTKPKIYT
jgi:hypothetical protein